jgi:hypothetical protein
LQDPTKFTQIWHFWFETIPSGNPGAEHVCKSMIAAGPEDARKNYGRAAPRYFTLEIWKASGKHPGAKKTFNSGKFPPPPLLLEGLAR